tara:strand:- start:5947 stop:6051 length:105 start_codon:yes stop_codon:yes gene_type:complete
MKFSKESNSDKEVDKILGRFSLFMLGFFLLLILL